MLILRAYPVLDRLAVELSCVHGDDPLASHLVYRSLDHNDTGDFVAMLKGIAEQVYYAAELIEHGEVSTYDDCPL